MINKKINLVPLYSRKTRKSFLILTGLGVLLLIVNILKPSNFVETSILLWGIAFSLTCVNFSKLGRDKHRDQLSRYITLKLTVTFFISILMATSFAHIFFNADLIDIKLYTVLIGNFVFLASHYGLYYFGLDENTKLQDEGFKSFIRNQKSIIGISLIISLITILILIFVFR